MDGDEENMPESEKEVFNQFLPINSKQVGSSEIMHEVEIYKRYNDCTLFSSKHNLY